MKLGLIFGILSGNFIYQLMTTSPDWGIAIERAYFQGLAFLAYYLCVRFLFKESE